MDQKMRDGIDRLASEARKRADEAHDLDYAGESPVARLEALERLNNAIQSLCSAVQLLAKHAQ